MERPDRYLFIVTQWTLLRCRIDLLPFLVAVGAAVPIRTVPPVNIVVANAGQVSTPR